MAGGIMKVARVFPRKTEGSPDDELAFFGPPPIFPVEVDEVHVSVAFTYDMPLAERLAKEWERVAPVKMGGPAFNKPGGEFVPGMYLNKKYTITSRGCPNNCWFCAVPKREPSGVRELDIKPGHIVQDDNLLATSMDHIRNVFDMLKIQKDPVQLMGLEAALLDAEKTDLLWHLRPKQLFFAYDRPEEYEPLVEAGKLLRYADFTRSHMRCYVLIGHKKDTIEKATIRLIDAWKAGFLPCAMLWHNKRGQTTSEWKSFHRSWMRPAAIRAMMKGTTTNNMR